jgi:hypothetical protein
MKTYTLNEVQDKLLGRKGTQARDKFENKLQKELTEKVKLHVELPCATINMKR